MTEPPTARSRRPPDAATAQALAVLVSDVDDELKRGAVLAMVDWAVGRGTPTDLSADEWPVVIELAQGHRALPILGSVFAPSNRPANLGDEAALITALAVDRALIDSVSALHGAGVDALVLKGNATAHLDYDRPDHRVCGDVDLLVKPEQFDRAIAALQRAGCSTTITHPFATPRFMHSETLLHPDGIEIDLHHRFAQASRDPRSCWDDAVPFTVGGTELMAPSMRWRFVHSCIHQMMNRPPNVRRVSGLLDMCRIYSEPGFSLGQCLAAAREVHLEAVVRQGVAHLQRLIGDPVDNFGQPQWRLSDRWLAKIVDGTDPIPGYASFITSIVNQRWRDRPRYVRELVWPTARYRAEVGRTPMGQLVHVAREIVGR